MRNTGAQIPTVRLATRSASGSARLEPFDHLLDRIDRFEVIGRYVIVGYANASSLFQKAHDLHQTHRIDQALFDERRGVANVGLAIIAEQVLLDELG
jgi:hypothetical protein